MSLSKKPYNLDSNTLPGGRGEFREEERSALLGQRRTQRQPKPSSNKKAVLFFLRRL